jgi:cytochrome c-type biogenesis protein
MAFAAGWTPCIGPILGAVLTYTASAADLNRGLVLLLAYSLGLAVPFILAALMIDRFMHVFQRYRGALVWTSRIAGGLLIAVGIMMLSRPTFSEPASERLSYGLIGNGAFRMTSSTVL